MSGAAAVFSELLGPEERVFLAMLFVSSPTV
jgi:hypothetical protein